MKNTEMIDIAIKALEELKEKGLSRVNIDTEDDGAGMLNLNIDVEFYEKPITGKHKILNAGGATADELASGVKRAARVARGE